jgi:hypothetical protein
VPGRLAPEGFLDGQGLGHGLTDQIGIAHRRRQVGGVREASEGVVDLLPGGAALLDEVPRVLPMKCLALLQAGGDGVVHDHVLAVKGHLPGSCEPIVPAPAVVILVKVILSLLTIA